LETLNADGWGVIWSPEANNQIQDDVLFHTESILGRKILKYLVDHFGTLRGRRTIEIGCGGAIYSLILAQQGAEITLLDYSTEALRLAEQNLRALNLNATLVQGDAFNPPMRFDYYDIALSFGTVEHYRYPKRFEICEMHAKLLRPNGVVIIETPNAAFVPHEILKFLLQKQGKWAFGFEKGFSYLEMRQMAKRLHLRHSTVVGSSLRSDIHHYLQIFRNSSTLRRCFPAPAEVSIRQLPQNSTVFDNILSRSVALLGVKSEV